MLECIDGDHAFAMSSVKGLVVVLWLCIVVATEKE